MCFEAEQTTGSNIEMCVFLGGGVSCSSLPQTECYALRHRDRRKDSVDARSLSSRGSDGEAQLRGLGPVPGLEPGWGWNSKAAKKKAQWAASLAASRGASPTGEALRGLMMTPGDEMRRAHPHPQPPHSPPHSRCYFKSQRLSDASLQSNLSPPL